MVSYLDFGYNGFLSKSILKSNRFSSLGARSSIPSGAISASQIIPPMNATTDIVFSSTDYNTAAWTTGVLYFANGTNSGTIDEGNTGDIAATTYVYYDREKLGVLQTTTNIQNTSGYNKLMVAIVELGAEGKDCKITPVIGAGLVVTGITTSQINFTPVSTSDIVATINASEEGIDISADKIAISGETTFSSNYDPSAKINTFIQDDIPTSIASGDLWFDSNDKNKLYRAASIGADEIKEGEWVAVRDTDIAQAISDAATAQGTADGKVITFYQDGIPTSEAIGDLWIDTNDGNKLYRAASASADEIKEGEWIEVQDEAIATAISDAATAQTTADSKIITFYQDAIPTATDVGDLWVDTDGDNAVYRAASVGADEIKEGEWELCDSAKLFTDTTTKTNMEGWKHASDVTKIDGGDIYTNSITANKIAVGQQSFVSTIVWTSTDQDTASWSSGIITCADTTAYSISSGNTGNIASTTYVYLDPDTSVTVLQTTTTATTAVGDKKKLIAIVTKGGSATINCSILVISSIGTVIDGGNITTNSLDADRIKASTIDVAVDVGTGSGSSYVRLDGGNNRIVVHDGTNPRIVIGDV